MPRKSALVASALGLAVALTAAAYEKAGERAGYRRIEVAGFEQRKVADIPKAGAPERERESVDNPIRKEPAPRMRHADGSSQIKPARDR